MVSEQYQRYADDVPIKEKLLRRFIDVTHEYTLFLSRDDNEDMVKMISSASTLMGKRAHDIYQANAILTTGLCELMFILRDIVFPEAFEGIRFDIQHSNEVDVMFSQVTVCFNALCAANIIELPGIEPTNKSE